jgi:hypothetical protein
MREFWKPKYEHPWTKDWSKTLKYESKLPKIDLEEMERRKLGQSRKKLLALLEEMK